MRINGPGHYWHGYSISVS